MYIKPQDQKEMNRLLAEYMGMNLDYTVPGEYPGDPPVSATISPPDYFMDPRSFEAVETRILSDPKAGSKYYDNLKEYINIPDTWIETMRRILFSSIPLDIRIGAAAGTIIETKRCLLGVIPDRDGWYIMDDNRGKMLVSICKGEIFDGLGYRVNTDLSKARFVPVNFSEPPEGEIIVFKRKLGGTNKNNDEFTVKK